MINDASCELLRKAGFSDELIHVVPDNMSSSEIQMVLKGRVNFFVSDPVTLNYRLQQMGIPPEKFKKIAKIYEGQEFYLAAGKKLKPFLLERIQNARDTLTAQGVRLTISAE